MKPTARTGFQDIDDAGIRLWFLDRDDVANFTDPIASLEALGSDQFVVHTMSGQRYQVHLTPELILEFNYLVERRKRTNELRNRLAPTPPALPVDMRGRDRPQVRLPADSTARPPTVPDPILGSPSRLAESPDSAFGHGVLTWKGRGQRLTVARHNLVDPLTYFSKTAPRDREASCIDLSLPVGQPVVEPKGALGYWPEYARMSPGQRANYLTWLAGGRKDVLGDIGYAFLYFYGLERRVLVDNQNTELVIHEVARLLKTYTFSGSFHGHLGRFLTFVASRNGLTRLSPESFDSFFGAGRTPTDEETLAVILAWLLVRDQPLPAHLAMRLAGPYLRSPRSVVMDRAPEEFSRLFFRKYTERFGEGLLLKAPKRDRDVVYSQPASPSLMQMLAHGRLRVPPILIPNVLGLPSQFNPLAELWAECVEELKPFSRRVAANAEIQSREAYEALPDALKADMEHPDKALWAQAVADNMHEDGIGLAAIAVLASIQRLEERAKLTLKQSQGLAKTAGEIGFLIEPDARITNRPYSWGDVVALFRADGATDAADENRYAIASYIFEFGTVAIAGGDVEAEEIGQITHFLENLFMLDPLQSRRLRALKQVLLWHQPSVAGIGKRLQTALTAEQRESVGQFFVLGLATANGSLQGRTLGALRTAYRALGLDAATLRQLLESIRGSTADTVEVRKGSAPARAGELIPPRAPHEEPESFRLDPELINKKIEESRQAAAEIHRAMEQYEAASRAPEPAPAAGASFAPPADERFADLDRRFHAFLDEVLTRKVWPRQALDRVARSHRLMMEGAVERINAWAQDKLLDNLLIDDGDSFQVQINLIMTSQ